MRLKLLLLGLAAAVAATAPSSLAQAPPPDVPAVVFRAESPLHGVLAGGRGERESPEEDARWAERRADDLTRFHARDGIRLLRLLAEHAGVSWPYRDIDVYLVRHLPTLSIQYPLTIAVGEIRQEEGRQEVPGGDFLVLTFAHQIAHYLLDPPPEPLAADRPDALEHPLLEEGNYRREAIVNLLAYGALEDLWGPERLRGVVEEPLWASYNPQGAFVDSLRAAWSLSASRPLVTWLLREGEDGPLVELAERLESARAGPSDAEAARPGGHGGPPSMAGTEVGFDLGQTAEGRLFIAFLDPRSPADAAGLRPGDIVLTIEGRTFASVSDAMRAVREAWAANREVNVSVDRQGREVFFQVH